MDAYRKGLSGKQAAWAAKKYHGHRVLPDTILDALEHSGIWSYLSQLPKLLLYMPLPTSLSFIWRNDARREMITCMSHTCHSSWVWVRPILLNFLCHPSCHPFTRFTGNWLRHPLYCQNIIVSFGMNCEDKCRSINVQWGLQNVRCKGLNETLYVISLSAHHIHCLR